MIICIILSLVPRLSVHTRLGVLIAATDNVPILATSTKLFKRIASGCV
eukprot:SAG11_NODE_33495_length_277_cov_0.578652_2_plen_47_part_01